MWRISHGVKFEQMKKQPLEHPIVKYGGSREKQERGVFKLPDRKLSPSSIMSYVKKAGIIDETDGSLLYKKLLLIKNRKIHIIAACCFDDDPYASSSEAVFNENRKKVYMGLEYASKACGEPEMAAVLNKHGKTGGNVPGRIKIINAPERYPAFDILKQNFYRSGKRAALIGAQACAAVYDAVKDRKPQTDTVVTVTGEGALRWFNCRVKIGTTVKSVLDSELGDYGSTVATGSSVTGYVSNDLSLPVKADTRVIFVIKKTKPKRIFPCIGCGRCVQACTRGIVPWAVFKEIETGRANLFNLPNVQRCIGCSACNAVCPSMIDLQSAVKKAADIKKSGDIYAAV